MELIVSYLNQLLLTNLLRSLFFTDTDFYRPGVIQGLYLLNFDLYLLIFLNDATYHIMYEFH